MSFRHSYTVLTFKSTLNIKREEFKFTKITTKKSQKETKKLLRSAKWCFNISNIDCLFYVTTTPQPQARPQVKIKALI